MDMRFEKRLHKAKHPRLRKHNSKRLKKFVRPRSNVAAVLEELAEGARGPSSGVSVLSQHPYAVGGDITSALAAPLSIAGGIAIAAVEDGIDALARRREKKSRAKALAKRRAYYEADAVTRQVQREAIEKARPKPENPCPTPEELTEAYLRRRESDEWKVRLGTLMIDLEEHVRRTYAITGNKFTGSSGGVKDWLKLNCPLLAPHYYTCQRFKRKLQEDMQ